MFIEVLIRAIQDAIVKIALEKSVFAQKLLEAQLALAAAETSIADLKFQLANKEAALVSALSDDVADDNEILEQTNKAKAARDEADAAINDAKIKGEELAAKAEALEAALAKIAELEASGAEQVELDEAIAELEELVSAE